MRSCIVPVEITKGCNNGNRTSRNSARSIVSGARVCLEMSGMSNPLVWLGWITCSPET